MPIRNLHESVSEEHLKTISDRVKAHEMQLAVTHELYRVVVTGDVTKNEPGMLENMRSMARAMDRIEQKLSSYAELDRRVREMEERHARVDEANKDKKSESRTYRFYFISLVITNLVSLLINWLRN